ncbi:Trm112 family protein [Phytoactinopolyspora mesophila]|uniref:Trm112 family protein n=1 Tax=Phytoactinopolyspora mesophila TaxID=2650750 RepID=A0A7K3M9G4_9ACTN|nr:Trm112 family protein [Phytoactinopolyspora mesophila]NDL59965.1 Trm112 family protein [Phytoactinopolyspora mesophila]
MWLDPMLAEVIVCPACHGGLAPREVAGSDGTERNVLACSSCALAYPVRDGIPVLLAEFAQPLGDAESERDNNHRAGPSKV